MASDDLQNIVFMLLVCPFRLPLAHFLFCFAQKTDLKVKAKIFYFWMSSLVLKHLQSSVIRIKDRTKILWLLSAPLNRIAKKSFYCALSAFFIDNKHTAR